MVVGYECDVRDVRALYGCGKVVLLCLRNMCWYGLCKGYFPAVVPFLSSLCRIRRECTL